MSIFINKFESEFNMVLIKFNIIFYFKVIVILLNIIIYIKSIKYFINLSFYKENNIKNNNKLNIYEIYNLDKINFVISQINYSFSFKFNITKVEYHVNFYDIKQNYIQPSHLSLFYKLHIFCHSKQIENNINIIYIANIINNKYYSCIEYIKNKEKINFGITIYKRYNYIESYKLNLFNNIFINYNNYFLENDDEFDPLIQMDHFTNINKDNINNNNNININLIKPIQLKKTFSLIPKFNIKEYLTKNEERWYFKNIYNNYFCFCKYSNYSKCLYKDIKQKYKYYLYLYFIDNNRNIYNKTDYLFADFSSENTAPGEAYLIFKEMFKQNLSVYYLTKREEIYKEYKSLENNISYKPIIFDSNYINGNFLEKYFDIFLRLKAVVSGAKIYSITNLFYDIEYITYICLTHGISYLKDFLYSDYYSNKIYNKILLPNSNLIISNAKLFGWKDDDIIRIGLPRWDLFKSYEKKSLSFHNVETNKNQSIFLMFTWRELKNNQNISKYYFKNILDLMNNDRLNFVLKEKNITLYYSLHHMIEEYKHLFNENKFIKYINQDKIIECLTKSDLVITDFSSIIFDIMVRNKPYIIFIPDSEDPNIDIIYNETYSNIINFKLKNNY